MTFTLELSCLLNLNDGILTLGQVPCDHSICLVPLISAYIHFKGLNKLARLNEVFLGKIELANLSIVTSYLFEVGTSNLSFLAWNKLDGPIPFSCTQSRFNSLVKNSSLNEMFNCLIELFLTRKPVSPLLFQGYNMRREGSFGKFNSLSESVTHHVRIECSIKNIHLFIEVTGLFMHSWLNQLSRNLIQLVMRNANIISGNAVCCFGWKAALEIKLNCSRIIAFPFFHFSCFSLLVGFKQPLEVVIFEFTNILMFEFFSNFYRLIPPVKFLVHGHSLFNFVVLN